MDLVKVLSEQQLKSDLPTLKIGDTVKVRDLDIAKDKDIVLMTDPDTPVVTVTAVHNVVPETEAEEAAEDDKAAKQISGSAGNGIL